MSDTWKEGDCAKVGCETLVVYCEVGPMVFCVECDAAMREEKEIRDCEFCLFKPDGKSVKCTSPAHSK